MLARKDPTSLTDHPEAIIMLFKIPSVLESDFLALDTSDHNIGSILGNDFVVV
jgi:hypothetical protein